MEGRCIGAMRFDGTGARPCTCQETERGRIPLLVRERRDRLLREEEQIPLPGNSGGVRLCRRVRNSAKNTADMP